MSFGLLSTTMSARDTRSWDSLAAVVGCRGNETLACMRKVPAGQLVEGMARTKMTAWPVGDNLTVPANRGAAWREARVAKGARVDEQHSPGRTGPGEPQYYDAALLRGPSPRATRRLRQLDAILSLYRSKPGLETDFDVAAAILTDSVWQCVSLARCLLDTTATRADTRIAC